MAMVIGAGPAPHAFAAALQGRGFLVHRVGSVKDAGHIPQASVVVLAPDFSGIAAAPESLAVALDTAWQTIFAPVIAVMESLAASHSDDQPVLVVLALGEEGPVGSVGALVDTMLAGLIRWFAQTRAPRLRINALGSGPAASFQAGLTMVLETQSMTGQILTFGQRHDIQAESGNTTVPPSA